MLWSLLGAVTRVEFVASDSSACIDELKYCFVLVDRNTLHVISDSCHDCSEKLILYTIIVMFWDSRRIESYLKMRRQP